MSVDSQPAGTLGELRTSRLLLRRWRAEDEAPMVAINSDPEVTELLNRDLSDASVAAFFGQVAEHWEDHGFGPWAVEPLGGPLAGRMVGFVGISYPTFLVEVATRPELGWRLSRESWGSGYATEAALLARDDAFTRLGLPELIAIIHPDNERSQRVATKLGMTIERQVHYPVLDRDVDVWQMDAPAR